MLENLDSTNWTQLRDLDGAASDLPKLIRSLPDSDEPTRQQNLEELALRVWSESHRSEATPRIVPFLTELATETTVPARSQIISLITQIGIGEERVHIPSGIRPTRYRADCIAREQRTRKALEREREMFARSARERSPLGTFDVYSSWEWESYQVVEAAVPELAGLLLDEDDSVRNAIIHGIAWFPKHAELVVPMLYQVLKTAECEGETANALIAIGMLTRNAEPIMPPPDFANFASTEQSPLVRTAAALAMARNPLAGTLQDVLCEYLLALETTDPPHHAFEFNQRHFVAHIALTLALWHNDGIDTIVHAVARGLEKSAFFGKYDTVRALIELGQPYSAPRVIGLVAPQLTNSQRTIMRAIADHGPWRFPFDETQAWGNFAQLLRAYGLPDSRAAMERLLTWGICQPEWWRALRGS